MSKKHKMSRKGFEAWFYKKFPGTLKTKRKILISIICLLYSISFVLIIMTTYSTVSADSYKNFNDRVSNTKLK